MRTNEDEETYWDRFGEESQTVFEIWWKQSRHHARDDEVRDAVVLFDKEYFIILLAQGDEPQGPYGTVESAILAGELNHVYEHTFQIDAPTLSHKSLQELLYYAGTLKHTLIINGKKWRVKAGCRLEPVPQGEGKNLE
jgi:hypothetical protein